MRLYKVTTDTDGHKATYFVAVDQLCELEDLIHKKVSYDSKVVNAELLTDDLIIKKTNED